MQSPKIFALVGLVLVFLSSGCAGGPDISSPLPGQANPAPVETMLVSRAVDPSPTLFIPPTVTSVPFRTPTLFVPAPASPTLFVPRSVMPYEMPVHIHGMRIVPKLPKQKQDITFYVSFVNSTGKAQEYRWFIFIYPAGKTAPIGQTSADKAYKIPPGVSEFAALNTWRTGSERTCVNYVAKVHRLAPDGTKPAFTDVNGKDFDLPFTVCP